MIFCLLHSRTHKYTCVTLHGDCQVDIETTKCFREHEKNIEYNRSRNTMAGYT